MRSFASTNLPVPASSALSSTYLRDDRQTVARGFVFTLQHIRMLLVHITVSLTGTFNDPSRLQPPLSARYPTDRDRCRLRFPYSHIARFNLIAIIVTEPGEPASQPSRLNSRPISLLILVSLSGHHYLADSSRPRWHSSPTFTVENVVWVSLVQARRFIGRAMPILSVKSSPKPCDMFSVGSSYCRQYCDDRNAAPALRGAVSQLHVVFGKQRENFCF